MCVQNPLVVQHIERIFLWVNADLAWKKTVAPFLGFLFFRKSIHNKSGSFTPYLFKINEMKNILIALLLVYTVLGHAQTPTPSISIVPSWERLDGPSAYVSKYAQHGNVLFAASEEALFTSIDGGLQWEYNTAFGRKRIRQMFAHSAGVVVIANETKVLDPESPFPSLETHQVYYSTDHGISWTKGLVFAQEPESFWANNPKEIIAKNDSVLAFTYEYYPSLVFTPQFQNWVSTDFGASWEMPFTGATMLNGNQDTFSFIRLVNSQLEGGYSGKDDFSEIHSVSLQGTPATSATILKTVYQNGNFYLFLKDKTLWYSADQGTTWNQVFLAADGTLNEVIWGNPHFFLRTENGVFRGTLQAPSALEQVYGGEQSILPSCKTFTPLASGYWGNTHLNQSIFSPDNGLNWVPRSAGLSSKVIDLRMECGHILARSGGKLSEVAGWFEETGQNNLWELSTAAEDYPPFSYLRWEFNGITYRYNPPFLYRSEDCDTTWETVPISFGAAPSTMLQLDGRLYIQSELDYQVFTGDSLGLIWETKNTPEIFYNFWSAGNYLFGQVQNELYRSEDGGDSWETFQIPLIPSRISSHGDHLFAVEHNGMGTETGIYRSSDFGETWVKTCEFPAVNGSKKATIPSISKGLIWLHFDHALYLSDDEGETWAAILQTPFSKRVIITENFNSRDTFIDQASRYFVQEDQLYALSEAHGLWRTNLDSILNLLHPSSLVSTPIDDQSHFTLYPNPTSHSARILFHPSAPEVILPERIRLFDAMGNLRMVLHNLTDGSILNMETLPTGIYWVEIQNLGHSEMHKIVKE